MAKQDLEKRKNMKVLINRVKALESTMQQSRPRNNVNAFDYASCNEFMKIYQD